MFARHLSPLAGIGLAAVRRAFPSRQSQTVERLEPRTLFAAGDLDPTFGHGGKVRLDVPDAPNGERLDAVEFTNGRIVLGGSDGGQRVVLAVLDSAGRRINSFSGDGIETELLTVPGGVLDMKVQPDNKIVVLAGSSGGNLGDPRVLARFNASGTLDTTFGGGDGQIQLTFGQALALGPNGRIVVAGNDGTGRIAVNRYTASGAADGQIRHGAATNERLPAVADVVVQSDGKVVVGGAQRDPSGSIHTDGFVTRFLQSLSGVDTAFDGSDGTVIFDSNEPIDDFDSVDALALDGSGRILVGLSLEGGEAGVRRLLGSGSQDPAFAASPFFTGAGIEDISLAPDGRIVASGETFFDGPALVRFNANGGRDTSFGGGDGLLLGTAINNNVGGRFSDVQSDGKILTAGTFGFFVNRHVASGSTPVGTVALGADGVLRVTGTEAGNDDVLLDDPGSEFGTTYGVEINGRRVEFAKSQVARVEAFGLGGNDAIYTGSQPSGQKRLLLNGGAGNDELTGGSGNDRLLGLDGNDTLFANGGDDVVDGGLGTDHQDGGSGADTVDYSFRNSAVRVDLEGDADDGAAGENDRVVGNVEHILGGRGNDTLTGNGEPNAIRGNGGNDTIRGGGNNDFLVGGDGQDRLFGDAGDDYLDARDGITDLVLDGGAGFDRARKDNSDPRTGIEQLV